MLSFNTHQIKQLILSNEDEKARIVFGLKRPTCDRKFVWTELGPGEKLDLTLKPGFCNIKLQRVQDSSKVKIKVVARHPQMLERRPQKIEKPTKRNHLLLILFSLLLLLFGTACMTFVVLSPQPFCDIPQTIFF